MPSEHQDKLTSYAYRLLAKREYSRAGLRDKLYQKFRQLTRSSPEPAVKAASAVDEVLDYFVEEGLQSDERFAGAYAREGIAKGWGPIKIRHKLRERRVADELIEKQLTQDNEFWQEKARELIKRLYSLPFENLQQKGKCYRFLAGRGFSSEQIAIAIKTCNITPTSATTTN